MSCPHRTTHAPRGSALLLSLLIAACGGSDGTGPTEPPGGPPENATPVASFVVERTGPAAPVGATFDASPSSDLDGQIVSYEWSFGGTGTATGRRVEFVFDRAGDYLVFLTVTDDRGATGTEQQTVTVEEPRSDDLVGVVWYDRNGDGVRQSGEEGVSGMRVFLDDNADGERNPGEESTTTSIGGIYAFSGLEPGEHRVTQELGIGWTNTVPGPGITATGARRWTAPARILGGQNAPADSFPFMASIQIKAQPNPQQAHICGGSLIAPQWVLTASHCLSDDTAVPFPPSALEIYMGSVRLDGSGVRIPVEATFINPGYSPAGGFYKRDISLVKLAQRMETTSRVFLPDSATFLANIEPGDRGTLIGWGRTGDSEPIPVDLQIAPIPLRPDSDCESSWNSGEQQVFESSMLCVGHIAGAPDSCSGDSGGPWMFEIHGRLHQLGAVSWGPIPCGRPTVPSAYASVPAMLAFIETHVPSEPSGSVLVTLGATGGRADFGNFH